MLELNKRERFRVDYPENHFQTRKKAILGLKSRRKVAAAGVAAAFSSAELPFALLSNR